MCRHNVLWYYLMNCSKIDVIESLWREQIIELKLWALSSVNVAWRARLDVVRRYGWVGLIVSTTSPKIPPYVNVILQTISQKVGDNSPKEDNNLEWLILGEFVSYCQKAWHNFFFLFHVNHLFSIITKNTSSPKNHPSKTKITCWKAYEKKSLTWKVSRINTLKNVYIQLLDNFWQSYKGNTYV